MIKILKTVVWMMLLFSVYPPAYAREDDENLRRMLKTRSNGQLTRFIADRNKAQRLRLVCDAQLRSARIPGSCFELMKLDGELQKQKPAAWLNRLCVARVGSSRDWRELRAVANNKSIPEKCREVALRRDEDLQYMDQAERPAEVFSRSF